MNPIQSLFLVSPLLACARAAGVSRPRCDTEHITPLCGVAAGSAAGGRLPSCPPLQSRTVREEAKPFTVTSSPGPFPQSREHMFEHMSLFWGTGTDDVYQDVPPLGPRDLGSSMKAEMPAASRP